MYSHNSKTANYALLVEITSFRYCDDFVLVVFGDRHHAEALREEVSAVLASLGLRLAPEKTAVVHIDEGFNFLGHHIRRQRKRGTSKYCVYTKPSKKAIQSIKDKVNAKTYRSTRHMDLDEVILGMNRSLAGQGPGVVPFWCEMPGLGVICVGGCDVMRERGVSS